MLAAGSGAVLSHRSAAGAWGIRPDGGSGWDVTIRSSSRLRPSPSIRVHRARLPNAEIGLMDGIPVTTVGRTLLDLAGVVPAHHLRRAVERADQLEIFDLRQVEDVLAAHPRRTGRRALIALLDGARRHGLPATRSDTEAAMLQLCLDHGLPRPQVNRSVDGKEVDFRWPEHGLVVEVDGWSTHRGREAFARDRVRDRQQLRRGQRVARFTALEVERSPTSAASELAGLLGIAGSSRPLSLGPRSPGSR